MRNFIPWISLSKRTLVRKLSFTFKAHVRAWLYLHTRARAKFYSLDFSLQTHHRAKFYSLDFSLQTHQRAKFYSLDFSLQTHERARVLHNSVPAREAPYRFTLSYQPHFTLPILLCNGGGVVSWEGGEIHTKFES